MIARWLVFASLLTTFIQATAQEWKSLGVDDLFAVAREEAFDGKRQEAREKLLHILESSPNYAEVRILLGRTYAWDGKYQEAIDQLKQVVASDPNNIDGINALTDAYQWSDDYESALQTANMGLRLQSSSNDFLYKKASALNSLERYQEAMTVINQLLAINPSDERATSLRNTIQASKQRYTTSASVGIDVFNNKNYDPAYYASLQLGRSNDWGSSIARLNYSYRFNTSGVQGEIDLYPRIAKGLYGYLNYGFSNSSLFPDHRLGAEIFSRLPKSMEASLGLRYLLFSPNDIFIYTGSFGIYHKNLWISLRPFITPDKAAGTSVSVGTTIRRYFGNPEDYLELNGGIGYSPEIRLLQSTEGLATNDIYTLQSQRVGVGFQKYLRYNLNCSVNASFAHQELSPAVGYVWITSLVGRIAFRF